MAVLEDFDINQPDVTARRKSEGGSADVLFDDPDGFVNILR